MQIVKHIVIFHLKEEAFSNTKAVNARLIKEKLEALNGKIEGMLKLEVGVNIETNTSADVVLYSEFISKKALDDYQIHPLHEEIKSFIIECRQERYTVDYYSESEINHSY